MSELLLDAAEAYHRDVSRAQGTGPDAVRQLLPRLRDPQFTKGAAGYRAGGDARA